MERDNIDAKRMVALTSVSQAAGLAVAYADDEHTHPLTKPVAAATTARQSTDMTWAEPQFRSSFDAPPRGSPRHVLTSALAQWLSSRSPFKAG